MNSPTQGRLRVLWYVNAPFPQVVEKVGLPKPAGGTWLFDLGRELIGRDDVTFGVAMVSEGIRSPAKFEEDGARFYVVPQGKIIRDLRRFGLSSWDPLLRDLKRVADDFQPDVIVVHGTEFVFGLLTPMVKVPVIISIQGIVGPFYPHYWGDIRGFLPRLSYPRALRDQLKHRQHMRVERRIFEVNQYFAGRTFWDRSQIFELQPYAKCFFEPHVLRPDFYRDTWRIEAIDRHTIYTTTTPEFRKGTVCLLEALAMVRKVRPDARLVIGGPIGYRGPARFIRHRLRELDLEDAVEFLGYVDGNAIREQLLRAHAYVIPSYIENSPQNLAEAQAIGIPSVASSVGGNPTMVDDGADGLLFNAGDPAVLAMTLLRVFDDDALATRLSDNATRMARKRHDPTAICRSHVEMCRNVLSDQGLAHQPGHIPVDIATEWQSRLHEADSISSAVTE